MEERRCIVCGRPFTGRSDKKFCSDLCRNEFHNERRRKETVDMARLNKSLLHNRIVLLRHSASGCVPRRTLALDHFNFELYTSVRRRFLRPTLFSCYEYSYFITRDGIVHISNMSDNDYL